MAALECGGPPRPAVAATDVTPVIEVDGADEGGSGLDRVGAVSNRAGQRRRLGARDPALDPVVAVAEQRMPGAREAKAGVSLDRSERESVEPGGDGDQLALIRERIPVGRDQIAGLVDLAGRGRMGDRLVDLASALEPDAGAPVQARDEVRLRAFQL